MDSHYVQIWPGHHAIVGPDIRWLINNQRRIVRIKGAKTMPHNDRPLIYFPYSGKFRIEFVGTYPSPRVAREYWGRKIASHPDGAFNRDTDTPNPDPAILRSGSPAITHEDMEDATTPHG